jgi:hypothetical protein
LLSIRLEGSAWRDWLPHRVAARHRPTEIDEDAIEADLRSRVDDIDLERSDAAALVWTDFLEHARRPLNFGEHFDDDHGNDRVSFAATRAGKRRRMDG